MKKIKVKKKKTVIETSEYNLNIFQRGAKQFQTFLTKLKKKRTLQDIQRDITKLQRELNNLKRESQ